MYGWRARVGLILPADNAVIEPELYSVRELEGVSFHSVRLTTTERAEMPEQGVNLSYVFRELGVDAIVYACAETSFLRGVDGNQSIAQAIIDHTGIPTVTATSAMVQALHFLGLQRVSLVAPYTEDRTRTMIEFLQHMSIDVDGVEQRDFAEGGTDPREWYECNLQPPTTAYLMARRVYRESVDGVVISATNFRTFEVISALEADLGKPVVTTNQAILWAVFQLLGIRCHIPVLGRLHNIERG